MTNKKIFLSIFLILFLISVTAVNAEDNSTETANIEITNSIEEIKLTNDDTEDLSSSLDENDKVSEIEMNGVAYFNASAAVDGDGSQAHPFKYLTDSRLPYGVTAYFADGVYEVSNSLIVYSNDGVLVTPETRVTFIGQSMNNTILRYVGEPDIALTVPDLAQLFVSDMTFDHFTIENNGRLDATNVAFTNNPGIDIHASYGYNNSFGGAIYSPGSYYYAAYGLPSYLILNNCLFVNNTAVYGGSIYHKNGQTSIRNTKFINSTSGLYGGAIATDGGDIVIENCVFDNYGANGDAGGAIYAKVTNLNVKNSNFTNGYSDFGGAICNLNAELNIENCYFENHTAKYEGGAIYVMYGNVTVKDTTVLNSASRDGGALFIDNCTSVKIKDTNFDSSIATRYGGVIFSNGNTLELENVDLGRGVALIDNLIHNQESYDYDIGYNSDYIMMKYNSSYSGVLPKRYDLRDYGYVTPVRDQQNGGNCWAFAGIAALESCILKATGISYDLSEENVKNLVELYSAYGWKYDTNEGGHSEMTWGNLISWLGPVLESEDKYDDYSTLSPLLDAVMHVQNVYYLPARQNALDNDAIKKAIMDYGGISVGIYWETSPLAWNENNAAYFHAIPVNYANHAVCIVGWDDDYDKNNFPMGDMAATNGAWIAKNSWNESWGDNGFFYISYYDPVVCQIGEANDVYTFILNDTQRYNRNYQYDIGGMTDFLYPNVNNETLYYKNTFKAIGNDILSAFSTIFEYETDFEAKVYINNELMLSQSGHSFGGYATIPLNNEFQLKTGDNFTVEVKISRKGGASIPICEVVTASRLTYGEGISFFSTNGNTWTDLYSFTLDRPDIEHRYASQVACIKAFTRSSDVILNSTIEISNITTSVGKTTQITAIVRGENDELVNTGFVTFQVNGIKETVKVKSGLAVMETIFDEEGTFDVNAVFNGGNNYKNSSAESKVKVLKTIIGTKITSQDVEFNENDTTKRLNATLTDENNNPIRAQNIKVLVDGKTYTVKTNSEGKANIILKLNPGEYTASIIFDGNDDYAQSSLKINIKVIGGSENNISEDNGTSGDNNSTGDNNATGDNNSTVDDNKTDTVEKTTPEITADINVNGTAANIIAKLPENATGNVTISVDKKEVTTQDLSNGKANFELKDLATGAHLIELVYNGDEKYNSATYYDVFEVGEKTPVNNQTGENNNNTNQSAGNVTNQTGENNNNTNQSSGNNTPETEDYEIISITTIDGNKANIDINVSGNVNGTVKVFVDEKEVTNATLVNGKANVTLNNLTAGVHLIEVQYDNASYYEAVLVNSVIPKVKKDTVIIADAALTRTANEHTKTGENGTDYTVTLTDSDGNVLANKTIQIAINGVHYEVVTDSDGKAHQTVNMESANVYTYAFAFQGDDEYNASPLTSTRLTVTKKATTITAASKTFKKSATKKLTVTLGTVKNADGKTYLASGKKITLKVNGKTYAGKTNAKNQVTFTIKLTKKGTFKAKVSFAGSKIYAASSKKINIVIK